jgi:hypothetical protein
MRPQEALAAGGALEMLLHMLKTGDTDVLECASAALANMVAFCEPNAIRVGQLGGVELLAGARVLGEEGRPSEAWGWVAWAVECVGGPEILWWVERRGVEGVMVMRQGS